MDKFDYKPYLKSVFKYMAEHKYTYKKAPKVILDYSDQDQVFGYTGYYDPNAKGIRLFVKGRKPKDVLRTFAHELIHWKQANNGVIEKSGYKSDKITEDKNLIKLEAEAYLKGNLAFRSWTEEVRKNSKEKLNESSEYSSFKPGQKFYSSKDHNIIYITHLDYGNIGVVKLDENGNLIGNVKGN